MNYFKPAVLKEVFSQAHSSSAPASTTSLNPPPPPPSLLAQVKYDLLVAITSYCFDIVSNSLVAIGPADSVPFFVFATALGCVTSGALPVLYSLSAGLLQAKTGSTRDIGQLYGAMSVVSAVSHAIQVRLFLVTHASSQLTWCEKKNSLRCMPSSTRIPSRHIRGQYLSPQFV